MELVRIVFQIGGGLALFLFSIRMLSDTLKKVSSGRLKAILQRATSNPLKGAFTGASVTLMVQSSSITVLLLIGLVNAGIMNLRQAVYVILGSEIGTTVTAQIVAFKVKMIFYPLMIAGFAMGRLGSGEKTRHAGDILLFLGMVFLAMKVMSDGSRPLAGYPQVLDIIAGFGAYPLLGILIGAVLTSITNSSSATTSLVIAMSMEGVIPFRSGIALIIGANIGTCALELIAAAGMSAAARQTSWAQFFINITGAVLFYPFLDEFARLVSMTASETPRLIANAHTLFNVTVSLLLMPFAGVMIAVLNRIVPAGETVRETLFGLLESKFLSVPPLALYEAEQEVLRMAAVVAESLKMAQKAFFENDRDAARNLAENEKLVDSLHERIGGYLNRISTVMLNDEDRGRKRALLHAITDLERIADLSENIAGYSRQEQAVFSDSARSDLAVFFNNALDVYLNAAASLKSRKTVISLDIHHMEDQVRQLKTEYQNKYLDMLEKNSARPVVDALYPYILKDIGRISDHATNISEHMLKMG